VSLISELSSFYSKLIKPKVFQFFFAPPKTLVTQKKFSHKKNKKLNHKKKESTILTSYYKNDPNFKKKIQ